MTGELIPFPGRPKKPESQQQLRLDSLNRIMKQLADLSASFDNASQAAPDNGVLSFETKRRKASLVFMIDRLQHMRQQLIGATHEGSGHVAPLLRPYTELLGEAEAMRDALASAPGVAQGTPRAEGAAQEATIIPFKRTT
ncbi:MAG: hypothetical protein KBE09_03835 [Candidatus Pacebacteria bacterium]|nr:hypothetical protein [Candidatus Paceibacterota bacterium]